MWCCSFISFYVTTTKTKQLWPLGCLNLWWVMTFTKKCCQTFCGSIRSVFFFKMTFWKHTFVKKKRFWGVFFGFLSEILIVTSNFMMSTSISDFLSEFLIVTSNFLNSNFPSEFLIVTSKFLMPTSISDFLSEFRIITLKNLMSTSISDFLSEFLIVTSNFLNSNFPSEFLIVTSNFLMPTSISDFLSEFLIVMSNFLIVASQNQTLRILNPKLLGFGRAEFPLNQVSQFLIPTSISNFLSEFLIVISNFLIVTSQHQTLRILNPKLLGFDPAEFPLNQVSKFLIPTSISNFLSEFLIVISNFLIVTSQHQTLRILNPKLLGFDPAEFPLNQVSKFLIPTSISNFLSEFLIVISNFLIVTSQHQTFENPKP